MSLDVEYVAPYRGWLNRETCELYEILTGTEYIRDSLREEWKDMTSQEPLIAFCVVFVKDYFKAIPLHVWDNPKQTVAWFEIFNRLTVLWGPCGQRPSPKRILQHRRTRMKVVRNYILPNVRHVSRHYSYLPEDTPQGRVMVFRFDGTKAMIRHVETDMTFLRVPAHNTRPLHLVNDFLDAVGMSNQAKVQGRKGFQQTCLSATGELKVTSLDIEEMKHSQAICHIVGILVDCRGKKCKIFLNTKCEKVLNHCLLSPLDVGRRYLWM